MDATLDEVLAMLGAKEVQLQKTQWALLQAQKKLEELEAKIKEMSK